jgi:hypothetical protein
MLLQLAVGARHVGSRGVRVNDERDSEVRDWPLMTGCDNPGGGFGFMMNSKREGGCLSVHDWPTDEGFQGTEKARRGKGVGRCEAQGCDEQRDT